MCNGPVKLIDLLDPVLMICRERETSSTTRSSSSRQDVAALAFDTLGGPQDEFLLVKK